MTTKNIFLEFLHGFYFIHIFIFPRILKIFKTKGKGFKKTTEEKSVNLEKLKEYKIICKYVYSK